MTRLIAPALALLLAANPAPAAPAVYAEGDFAAVEKVDAHMHLYGEMPEFAARAAADGFRVLTINVNYRDFPPIAVQQRDAAALARAWPERIAFAATFDAAGSGQPGWLAGVERGPRRPSRRARSRSSSGRTSACSTAMPTAARS
jgi:hypothetical protein